jgi:hypothetical protein
MAALNFPATPTLNQVYTANGVSYKWDGTSWINNTSGPAGYTGSQGPIGDIPTTFETISNNIRSFPYVINRSVEGVITSVVYTAPAEGTITKSFTYSAGVLSTVTLSGPALDGVVYTKTLTYDAGLVTGASYAVS